MADFEDDAERFRRREVRVVALSTDDRDDAREMRERTDFSFPILYGLDPAEIAERTGAFVHRDGRSYLHATAFILDPEGRVRLAVYSSGAVGRLRSGDALTIIQEMTET